MRVNSFCKTYAPELKHPEQKNYLELELGKERYLFWNYFGHLNCILNKKCNVSYLLACLMLLTQLLGSTVLLLNYNKELVQRGFIKIQKYCL